jgi:hypothetical protein
MQEAQANKPAEEALRRQPWQRRWQFGERVESLCKVDGIPDGVEAITALGVEGLKDNEAIRKTLGFVPEKSYGIEVRASQLSENLQRSFDIGETGQIRVVFGLWCFPPLTDCLGGSETGDLVHIPGEAKIAAIVVSQEGAVRSLSFGSHYKEWWRSRVKFNDDKTSIPEGAPAFLQDLTPNEAVSLALEIAELAQQLAPPIN